mmetsp:Transcript_48456/g.125708  ORF Transcript_48456/g.125708 Transcript_48456/m.125708 type:complete len:493 (-) Transcript_48456:719-2197(-)
MKRFPVGVHSFDQLAHPSYNYAFIDRSWYMIFAVCETTTLILRPRRTGKTMFLQMIAGFLSNPDYSGVKSGIDFTKLKIYERMTELSKREECSLRPDEQMELLELTRVWKMKEQFPVLFVTFCAADSKPCTLEDTLNLVKDAISDAVSPFVRELLSSDKLDELDKEYIQQLASGGNIRWERSLRRLTALMRKHFQQNIVLLVDEYDSLINSLSWEGVCYDANRFAQLFWVATCKDNISLHTCILTGVFRYLGSGLFSGANNMEISDVIVPGQLAPVFGFSEDEVQNLMQQNSMVSHMTISDLREHYNGYLIGDRRLYNPFSIMQCLKNQEISNYWCQTGHVGSLVQRVKSDASLLSDIQKMYSFEDSEFCPTLPCDVRTARVSDMSSESFFWYTLLQSGYVSLLEPYMTDTKVIKLRIPNKEMASAFSEMMNGLATPSMRGSKMLSDFTGGAGIMKIVTSIESVLASWSLKNLNYGLYFQKLKPVMGYWIYA